MTSDETTSRGAVLFPASAPRSIEMAAEMIASGGLVAIPTDTVYGIAAAWKQIGTLERMYLAKGRDRAKSIPLLVSSMDALQQVGIAVAPAVALLLDQFWPGALTFALPAPKGAPAAVVAADGTVGVRMPNHRLALELIERAGGVVACTSANLSGHDPATSARDVMSTLGDVLDGVVDGGLASGGVPSTVAALRDGQLTILRQGAVAADELQRAWREVTA